MRLLAAALLFLVWSVSGLTAEPLQQPSPDASEASQPEKPHSEKSDQAPTSKQQRSGSGTVVVNVFPTPKTEEKAEDDRREREEKTGLDRRLVNLTSDLAFFTGGVFVATVILAIATGALGYATHRLVKGAEQTAERQLRAYVHVRDVRMLLMNSGYDPNIHVIIKNYGQTPASSITNTFKCIPILDRTREREFNFDQAQTVELADLAPTQRVFSTPQLSINYWASIKPLLHGKQQMFYVFGRIDYQDVFGQAR